MSAQESESNISGFERISNTITTYSGSSPVFIAAVGFILLWAVTGPLFHFSNTWLLIVNTATSIITFLMVFLIQKSQNKESIAVQLKLNELIAASTHASNRLLNIQDLSEEELKTLYEHYRKLVELTQQAQSNTQSHSVEDAIEAVEEEINDELKNADKT
ncbi:MAG: Low affinity iron permease [Mucilaginibacter sp.]|nr:Low affinity iron permease [Mucilaginibacter sp.]